jgi:hypothetical protein
MQDFLAQVFLNREPGLPDYSWYNKPKRGKIYQSTTNCPKWPQNTQNGLKFYQMNTRLSLQDPPKFTQIVIFGLKINHLPTLIKRIFLRDTE